MSLLDLVFRTVLHLSVGAVPLLAAVVLVRWAGRRWVPPGMIFALWVLAAGLLLVPWRVPLPAGWGGKVVAWFSPPRPAAGSARPALSGPQGMPAARIGASNDSAPAAAAAAVVRGADTPETIRPWWNVAGWVWLAGFLALVALRVAAVIGFRRRLGRSAQAGDLRLERVMAQCGRQLGVARLPRIATTPLVSGPALHGLWRPCLLVSPDLVDRLDAEELTWVVRHELAHLQRRDLWSQLVLQLAVAVHWFNPLVWLAMRLARHDCELACDAAVLRRAAPGAATAYGSALLQILGSTRHLRSVPAAIGIIESRTQIMDRIDRIARFRRAGAGRLVASGLLVTGIVGLGLARGQESTVKPSEGLANSSNGLTPTPAAAPAGAVPAHSSDGPTARFPTTADFAASRQRMIDQVKADPLSHAALVLRAVGEINGVPVALVDLDGDPQFVVSHSSLAHRFVLSVDAGRQQVVIKDVEGAKQTLSIEDPQSVAFPRIPALVEDRLMEPEGIREAERRPILSSEVMMAWARINRDAKVEILLNFLKRGLVVNVIKDPNGSYSGFTVGQLFAERAAERSRQRKEAFLASLTPEQREEFNQGIVPVIMFTAPAGERDRQAALANAIVAKQRELVAKLTPEQRTLYDAWQGTSSLPGSK